MHQERYRVQFGILVASKYIWKHTLSRMVSLNGLPEALVLKWGCFTVMYFVLPLLQEAYKTKCFDFATVVTPVSSTAAAQWP